MKHVSLENFQYPLGYFSISIWNPHDFYSKPANFHKNWMKSMAETNYFPLEVQVPLATSCIEKLQFHPNFKWS